MELSVNSCKGTQGRRIPKLDSPKSTLLRSPLANKVGSHLPEADQIIEQQFNNEQWNALQFRTKPSFKHGLNKTSAMSWNCIIVRSQPSHRKLNLAILSSIFTAE
eukprot:5013056-Amphidinium_carterae.1